MKIRYKTKKRSQIIYPELIGKTIKVYNGIQFLPVLISSEMIGHKLGEFSITKKIGSSIHLSEKNKKKQKKPK